MRVDFKVNRKSKYWEIVAEMEETDSVQIWRNHQQPTLLEFQLAVRAALAGMSAMASIVGLKMEMEPALGLLPVLTERNSHKQD